MRVPGRIPGPVYETRVLVGMFVAVGGIGVDVGGSVSDGVEVAVVEGNKVDVADGSMVGVADGAIGVWIVIVDAKS